MPTLTAIYATFGALFLAAVSLGGGLYECFLIDRAWPANPALVQPARGGIDRKRFWIPAHTGFEVALVVALWSAWPTTPARYWLLIALASHVVMRVWSFLYFVPRALRFERAGDLSPEMQNEARAWVRWSAWRLPLDGVTFGALCLAATALLSRS